MMIWGVLVSVSTDKLGSSYLLGAYIGGICFSSMNNAQGKTISLCVMIINPNKQHYGLKEYLQ